MPKHVHVHRASMHFSILSFTFKHSSGLNQTKRILTFIVIYIYSHFSILNTNIHAHVHNTVFEYIFQWALKIEMQSCV